MNDTSTHNSDTPSVPDTDSFSRGPVRPGARTRDPRSTSPFAKTYAPIGARPAAQQVVSALLKRPAQVVYEVIQGNRTRTTLLLLFITVVTMLGYGVVMGLFSGGHQLWAVPLKVCLGLLLSGLICLPSLYIFTCLAGGEQSVSQVSGLLMAALALSGILLVGFAPVAWVFSQATNADAFMGGIHLAFWGIGILFGLRLLESALVHLNRPITGVFKTWAVIFIMVVLQMTTTLRPLVGEYQGARLLGKKFFLYHWGAPDREAPVTHTYHRNRR